ncbi:Oligoxyloglucan reducing end-specific cellobiohydrolase [Basidiobolus meristosporus CBS 931.73]|uniref:Oligoxyloglucan reducing end-specific cellobiohydrolase n=1 Tax=Basidiobolus meristosporus CBS 931.73 TaxID=1314790 RepID=A0A1Y1X4I7_9FUNG|nr:Oligoxyloglucan reducing end-specific cellobiohydrolase [Basidiobolus meristosporus CBS 931.73]|eukprot:ORX80565.1 Oligoxyloglucan reducing end-specific cellobiohydrolase [Basidiobolus meristosporus CBS 931.73]
MSLLTRGPRVRGFWLLVLAVYSLIAGTGAGDVTVRNTGLTNLPTKLFYFEDSGVILYLDTTSRTVLRSDNEGGTWSKVSNVPDSIATDMYSHPYDKQTAIILTEDTTHYITHDRGSTWTSFKTPLQPSLSGQILSFHAERGGYILFTGSRCEDDGYHRKQLCTDETYYTRDAFATEPSLLKKNVEKCIWGRSTPYFQNVPEQLTLCLEYLEGSTSTLRLVQSEDYFRSFTVVQFNEEARDMGSVVGLSIVDKFLVAALKHKNSEDMSLFITQDAVEWDMANLPIPDGLKQNAYTLLESSSHTLVIDVVTSSSAKFGNMFVSNSNGSFYTNSLEYTNRNDRGIVDYERVQGVEGIVLSNIVTNWKAVDRSQGYAEKAIQSKISFDNGGHWRYLKPPKSDSEGNSYRCSGDDIPGNCNLHLHSVSRPHNYGKVYSSVGAPGILMGVGNVGKALLAYEQGDTFLSDDGGLTWREVAKGAHKYEMGDTGSLLVMVDDEAFTDKVLYSSNRGKTWKEQSLGVSVRAKMLTTDPESTTSSFLLIATVAKDQASDFPHVLFQLDFDNLLERKCVFDEDSGNGDFEKWIARNLEDGPDCIMGHTTAFWRRKAEAQCYVGEKYKDPVVIAESCPCEEEDFECDYNFVRDAEGRCIQAGSEKIPRGQCKNAGDTYLASSGYRKIPGNTCDPEKGKRLDEPVEKECPSSGNSPAPDSPSGAISHRSTVLTSLVDGYFYFSDSPVVLIRTRNGEIWRSPDEGANWKQVLKDSPAVMLLIMHEWDNHRAYFFTEDGKMLATTDRGETFSEVSLPLAPNTLGLSLLDFHPDEPDWLLFIGSNECPNCHSEVFFTKNHGRDWSAIETFAHKCIFGKSPKFANVPQESIFCSSFKNKDPKADQMVMERNGDPLQLIFIDGKRRKVMLEPMLEYAMLEEFLLVATEGDQGLTLQVSTDGESFSETVFPPNTRVNKNAFTVLQSSTGSVFLDVFQSTVRDAEYGTLYVSNSDGKYYSQVLKNTNRNNNGVVDFEKMKGVDGIILANEVANAEKLGSHFEPQKKIRTVISRDDGRTWKPLQPPKVDASNNPITCNDPDECQLHLHSKTDILSESIFSVPSAAGLMMGVGNVGPYLLPYEQGNTYITRDAGLTWKEIRRGESLYEFGDSGGLLVVVDDEKETDKLMYSWNYGQSWETYTFSDEAIRVSSITTEPKSTSLKFLIFGITATTAQRFAQQIIISVDFSTLEPRKCVLDESSSSKNDFELWNPGGEAKCLLGQETEHWRRKEDRLCYLGDVYGEPKVQQSSCECTELDYQCDYNFWRNSEGKCELYGTDPDRPHNCPAGETYEGSSGYTKIPTSKCKGGLQKDTKVTRKCSELSQVRSVVHQFDSEVVDYQYFKKSDHILMLTKDQKAWLSYDEGYSWEELIKDADVGISDIYMHPYSEDVAFFITGGKKHYYTADEGRTVSYLQVPAPPNGKAFPVLSFHPRHPDWLIYMGERDCDSLISLHCRSEAYYSLNGGTTWTSLRADVRVCQWATTDKFTKAPETRIFCEQYPEGTNHRASSQTLATLVRTDDYFKNTQVAVQNTVGYAIFEEFMVVSQVNSAETGMLLHVSVDGENFALAQFPGDSSSIHPAYTILESNTHSVFLHASDNAQSKAEYGTIFNSNANGTYFTTSIDHVNRDERGLVDFEKMAGIDGVAMVNQVINPNSGEKKKTRSLITHDNGRSWNLLTPPETDFHGSKYKCQGDECSLHIHSYTERQDPQNLFSSSSAVGLMMAVGNVGDHLTDYTDGDTFLSRDAGKTWKEIRKEAHMYEFGDHGAILMLANDEEPTDHISYSLDEGKSFVDYRFTEANRKIRLSTIAIEPQSTSRKFLLFGKTDNYFSKQVVVQVDFNGLNMDKCNLETGKGGDFELWDPADGKCLFGREVNYYRRLPDKMCFVGDKFKNPQVTVRNCTCTEADFECDYNFIRTNGKCVLAEGARPLATSCSGGAKYYQVSSGYRKMPISSCEGGENLARPLEYRCPNSGLSGGAIAALVLVPLLVVLCVGFILLRRYRTLPTIRVPAGIGRLFTQLPLRLPHLPIPAFISRLFSGLPFLGHRRSGYTQVQSEEPFDVLLDDYDSDDDMDV